MTDLLMKASLMEAVYHQRKRESGGKDVPKKTPQKKKSEAKKELGEALERARQGDHSALSAVRRYLDDKDE